MRKIYITLTMSKNCIFILSKKPIQFNVISSCNYMQIYPYFSYEITAGYLFATQQMNKLKKSRYAATTS